MIKNPVNILALIMAIAILLKSLWILASPKGYVKKSVKTIKEQWGLIVGLTVVLAVVTGYYVLTEIGLLTAVAALAFTGSVMAFSMVLHQKAMVKLVKLMAKDRKMCLISMLPWVVGAVYVLYMLFA